MEQPSHLREIINFIISPVKEAELDHHLNYHPPKIIRLCRSCHGKLHKKDFPNPLWKEKSSSGIMMISYFQKN